MKVSNKLTDEKLASLIESGFGKMDFEFSDLSSFEMFSVAENAMRLVDGDEHYDSGLEFDVSAFGYEPLAMCGFLGDESNEDIVSDDDLEDDEDFENNTQ